jgi:hypothetical protein
VAARKSCTAVGQGNPTLINVRKDVEPDNKEISCSPLQGLNHFGDSVILERVLRLTASRKPLYIGNWCWAMNVVRHILFF